jgi:hypothetical protein
VNAVQRIARLREVNPAAGDLALACSLAFRVEPALLRSLRLLLPGADAGAATCSPGATPPVSPSTRWSPTSCAVSCAIRPGAGCATRRPG